MFSSLLPPAGLHSTIGSQMVFQKNGQLDAGSAQGAEPPKQSCWEGTARCQAGLLQKQRYGTPSMLNLHAGMSCVLPQQQQRQLGLMHDLRRCLRGDADRLSHLLLQQQLNTATTKAACFSLHPHPSSQATCARERPPRVLHSATAARKAAWLSLHPAPLSQAP